MSDETKVAEDPRWPGVHRAYDFVMPSYQMLMSRFEAADNRLTAMLALASTLTLGAPLLAKSLNPNVSFNSAWFRLGVGLFIVLVIVGLVGRSRGRLVLPNPRIIYERSLHENEWSFKKNAIYFAGQHFDQNAVAIRTKGNFALAVTLVFLGEVLTLLAWVAR
jgi:hypothetical protein